MATSFQFSVFSFQFPVLHPAAVVNRFDEDARLKTEG